MPSKKQLMYAIRVVMKRVSFFQFFQLQHNFKLAPALNAAVNKPIRRPGAYGFSSTYGDDG